jgi:hypothetical protein
MMMATIHTAILAMVLTAALTVPSAPQLMVSASPDGNEACASSAPGARTTRADRADALPSCNHGLRLVSTPPISFARSYYRQKWRPAGLLEDRLSFIEYGEELIEERVPTVILILACEKGERT